MIDNIIKQSMTEDVLISSEIASSMHNPLNIKIYDEIDSTNRQMKDNIRKGEAACPDLIIAGCQTAGRGRLGRKFESPQGTGIYMTYKIDPDKAASNPILITSAAAVAVAGAVRQIGFDASIKWVNDIYVNSKKVCGILAESVCNPDGSRYIVLGIGINYSTGKDSFSDEVKNIAGSLYEMDDNNRLPAGAVTRNRLIALVMDNFIDICKNIDSRQFMKQYRDWSMVLKKNIRYQKNGIWTDGIAVEIDDNGALIVETEAGRVLLNTGEISLRLK